LAATIFLESGLEEIKLIMEANLVTQGPGLEHNGGKNGLFAGMMLM
jgi:hypothetical protein